ncbi:MFS transporter [Aliidiomarina taiwanensis]|uniref:MFS transporter n=1 Tax=Aliidiomarina taiwanensis TaxID=946228 RepID=A0A432X885_9GAMM|nr:MFS transporter [Aliidiomarina taiwanensis]RUO43089.1 MFS transporter [Aliidiomarina taiwanensis]
MQSSKLNPTEKKAAVSLAAIFSLRMLGLFLIMPVLAIYGQSYPDYTPLLVGIAIGAYGLTQAMLQIPMGIASDRWGRKPIILGGLAIFALGSVVAALADTLAWVIVGRVLQGAGAIAGAILALAADSAREEQRPKVMASIGMGIALSFVVALIVAPLLGAVVGVSGLFWLTAALTLASMVAFVTVLPVPQQRVPSRDILPVPKELKRLFKNSQLQRLNSGVLVLHLVLTALFVTLPSQLVEVGLAAKNHSWLYLPTLLLSFAVMVPMMLRAIRHDKVIGGLRTATLMIVSALVVIAVFSQHLASFVLAVWLFFIGFNYLEANLPALLSQHAPAGNKGSASGIYTTFQFFGAFLGGVLGGTIAQFWGAHAVMIFCIVLLLCWLAFTVGMQKVSSGTRVTLQLGSLSVAAAGELATALSQQPGVDEAVVIAEEQTAYLKVNKQSYKADEISALIATYEKK